MSGRRAREAPLPDVRLGDAGSRRTGRSVSIDWLDLSSKTIDVAGMLEMLKFHLGKEFGRSGVLVLRDDDLRYMGKGPLGLVVQADLVGSENRCGVREPWVSIRFPGKLCQAVGTAAVLDLVEALEAEGGMNVSRIDLALDDYERTFTPRKFAEACVSGRLDDETALLGPGVVTRVRRDNWEWSRRLGGCFWLGGRKSSRLLRVYDKDAESGGQVSSTRVELQCRDSFGDGLMGELLKRRRNGGSIVEVFFDHLVGFVDLREPCGSRSGSQKWRRVSWWQALIGEAKAVAVLAADDSSVWEWVRAMQLQCGGFVGVLMKAAGVKEWDLGAVAERSRAGAKVVGVLREIRGTSGGVMSREHRVRLGQLMREREPVLEEPGAAEGGVS